MAYDWRPTGTRTATTMPGVAAVMAHHAAEAPAGEIGVAALVEEFVREAEAGRALNRSGRPYRPSALRDLGGILRFHVVRDLGDLRVEDVRLRHVQALVDRLTAEGLSVSRVRSVISAARALFGYAIERGDLDHSPADGVAIPRDDGGFDETWSWTQDLPRQASELPRAPQDTLPAEDEHQPIALLPERILSSSCGWWWPSSS